VATISTKQAAMNVMAAELKAAQDLETAVRAFDTAMSDIQTGLDYPTNFRSQVCDAINGLRGAISYPLGSQIPEIIRAYTPPEA